MRGSKRHFLFFSHFPSPVLGAYGEIELVPVNLQSDGSLEVENGDVFLDPLFYLADAAIFVPC
jgi:hypothetical protein